MQVRIGWNGHLSVVHDQHPDKRSEGDVAKKFHQRALRLHRQPGFCLILNNLAIGSFTILIYDQSSPYPGRRRPISQRDAWSIRSKFECKWMDYVYVIGESILTESIKNWDKLAIRSRLGQNPNFFLFDGSR